MYDFLYSVVNIYYADVYKTYKERLFLTLCETV